MIRNRFVILLGFIGLFLLSYSATNLIYGVFANKGDKISERTNSVNFVKLTNNNSEIINSNTKITKIEYFKCGEQNSTVLTNQNWLGKSYLSLQDKYKSEDGWLIGRVQNAIYVSRHVDGFCPKHNKRHFGIYKGQLAIYQGPLGFNDKVLAVEKSIKIADLPKDFQAKLQEAMSLNNTQANQSKIKLKPDLKQELEFANEAEVEEAMQNLDEYTEE